MVQSQGEPSTPAVPDLHEDTTQPKDDSTSRPHSASLDAATHQQPPTLAGPQDLLNVSKSSSYDMPGRSSLDSLHSDLGRPSFSTESNRSVFSLAQNLHAGNSSESLDTAYSADLTLPPIHLPPILPQTQHPRHNNQADDSDDLYGEETDQEQQAVEQAEEGSIIVDSDDLGTDDGYGTDTNTTASTSLAESVREFIYENGRRYHKFREGRYNFPNDDVEQQREDMKHQMVKMLCGQLFFAPIERPQEILDIGTGTGIWAIEMADEFESAQVLGVDLSPHQPDWVPPNVRFMIDDVESPWLHPRNHFDYIHSRHTVMAIKDWPRLMRRALECMRPGGWFEMQEVYHFPISANDSMPANHPIARYWSLINEGLENLGVNFHAAAGGKLANMMRDAGFVNVTERVLQIPIGTWPKNKVLKTVGLYWRTILLDGIQAIALGPLTRGLGWSTSDVEMLLMEVRKAYKDNSCLLYMPFHIIYGQKPA
ncbi:S-adenosyl-L-methionine-dependent methyltransferase [Apiosordaria backusii]|uniref:S-adenosyl-L-methionine-dependent methyltransferase n=1 Tax=Apiosordaria backusii TaxID=314023 RepID=A0AA40AN40_9PEZI|nr:S-adenosyl-L-methionine-dependent methyltransferase [Apiosordaria backusii]